MRGQTPHDLLIEAGEYEIGAGESGFAYDNERSRHTVELASFEIDRTPVTNADWIDFMDETDAVPPLYWERDGEGRWLRTAMGRADRVDLDQPVIHVDHAAATAFAEWAGKRLPTEFEWEAAARTGELRVARRGLGVDVLGLRGLPGLRGVPLRRVLEGLLRLRTTRCSAADRGQRTRASSGPRFRNWDLPQAPADLFGPSLRKGCVMSASAETTPDVSVDVHLPPGGPLSGMAADVRIGLTKPFKELSPRYFYDERGSELFEQITELPEYYPTRAERAIL